MRYVWPGLPQMLGGAGWSSLGIAIGFALLLNLTLAATLLWGELLTAGLRMLAWGVVLVVWLGSGLISYAADRRRPASDQPPATPDTFATALGHYLKGDWFAAEQVVAELLRRNPRDVEAGLLRATLLRHAGRLDEAGRQLDRLELFDAAARWDLEIHRERNLLAELRRRPGPPSRSRMNWRKRRTRKRYYAMIR